MEMKKYVILVVLFAATLMIFLDFGLKKGYADNTVLFQDDFSKSSNNWILIGKPSKKPYVYTGLPTYVNNAMRLTYPTTNQVGTIWLSQKTLPKPISPPYTVTFSFQIKDGSERADGIVFMFNKLQNTSPVDGGGMGFEANTGYGVEFDTYKNDFDPDGSHITLFKNNPDHSTSIKGVKNLLQQTSVTSLKDTNSHFVKINVGIDYVTVYLDNVQKINYSGEIDRINSGIGFTASTGSYYNTQTIDNILFTKQDTVVVAGVNSTLEDGIYPRGSYPNNGTSLVTTVVPIQVSFNDIVNVTGQPVLALNTLQNAVYTGGSGTKTLTFSYYVKEGDLTSDLNYSAKSSLILNNGTIKDSSDSNAVLTLPGLASPGSLGTNRQIVIDTESPTIAAGTFTAGAGSSLGAPRLNLSGAADIGSDCHRCGFQMITKHGQHGKRTD
jgi:hypothetical protein